MIYEYFYQYFYDYLFASPSLLSKSVEIGGNSYSVAEWLSTTCAVLSMVAIVCLIVWVVIGVFRLFAGLFTRVGR